jgi:hypothetical protein
MTIPDKIKIAGYTYEVDRPDNAFPVDDMVCDGVHDFNEQTISVAKTGNTAHQQTVFMHEVVHGIIECFCRGVISHDIEEAFTEQFSKGLYQVIKDNPTMFAAESTGTCETK